MNDDNTSRASKPSPTAVRGGHRASTDQVDRRPARRRESPRRATGANRRAGHWPTRVRTPRRWPVVRAAWETVAPTFAQSGRGCSGYHAPRAKYAGRRPPRPLAGRARKWPAGRDRDNETAHRAPARRQGDLEQHHQAAHDRLGRGRIAAPVGECASFCSSGCGIKMFPRPCSATRRLYHCMPLAQQPLGDQETQECQQ